MTDSNDQQQTPNGNLTGAVTNTFVHPCLDCGTTVHVVAGQEQPHEHKVLRPGDGSPAAFAWWQGFDAARESALDDRDLCEPKGGEDPERSILSSRVDAAAGAARVARYAEVIYEAKQSDCEVQPYSDLTAASQRFWQSVARAVVAVADEEQAELRADVARLRGLGIEWMNRYNDVLEVGRETLVQLELAQASAEAAEARLDALVAELRGLAHHIAAQLRRQCPACRSRA
jgi:hypothetical protein